MAMAANPVSLRAGLTRRLALALLAVGIIAAISAYNLGSRYGNRAYDRAQADDVTTLADQIVFDGKTLQLNLPDAALKWLLADDGDVVLFRVTDLRDGNVIGTNGDLGPVPSIPELDDRPVFHDTYIARRRMRVGIMRHTVSAAKIPVLVEIGETLGKRDQMTEAILGSTILFMSVISLVVVGLVWHGVGRALAPLRRLEAEAKLRSATDLTPLDPLHAPEEVRGMIIAINQMMARVSSAMQSQSHFIANAAHQLRTPLSGLRLQAQLGLNAQSMPSMRASLCEVEASAVRASHLVENLLVLAKAETVGLTAESRPVNFHLIARQVIERYLPLADRHAVDLGLASDTDAAWVSGSEFLFAELLGNLVDNAIRHGRQGGNVTIDIHNAPDKVTVVVLDDGPGFGEEKRDQIFTRFYRPDSSVAAGTGLGLAIVHEIAGRFDGTVTLISSPGNGSRFELQFPRVDV